MKQQNFLLKTNTATQALYLYIYIYISLSTHTLICICDMLLPGLCTKEVQFIKLEETQEHVQKWVTASRALLYGQVSTPSFLLVTMTTRHPPIWPPVLSNGDRVFCVLRQGTDKNPPGSVNCSKVPTAELQWAVINTVTHHLHVFYEAWFNN